MWYKYLRERRRQCKGRSLDDPLYEDANNAHERGLVFMHKMPRIWIDYGEFLMRQEFVTRSRRTFDRLFFYNNIFYFFLINSHKF